MRSPFLAEPSRSRPSSRAAHSCRRPSAAIASPKRTAASKPRTPSRNFPALLGVSLAAIGPLSLLGAALAGPLIARWGLGSVMIVALFLETLSRLLLPFARGTPLEAAAIVMSSQALLGLTVPLWTISSFSLAQAVTPEHLLGRVNSAVRFVALGVAPPASFGAGVLADVIGLRATLFIAEVLAALAFLYLLASPVRGFRQPTESAAH